MNARIAAVVDALHLPAGARVDKRVGKALLSEHGAPTAADRRAIQSGIEELRWVGVCKPNTIGVKAFADDTREYLEIAVIAADLRPKAKGSRLMELIHRAVPYPVLLVAAADDGLVVSVAHKRHAQNEADKVVAEKVVATAAVKDISGELERAFLIHLAIDRQPSQDLRSLYEGWCAQIEALAAARLTGTYSPPEHADQVASRREALASYEALSREITKLRAKAAREKQMNRKVDLNVEILRLETAAKSELNRL